MAIALPLALRAFSACFGHSGEGQLPRYEGAPYGGDYEAQRHWMEITYHLPVGKWYHYDLQYWGLDYPPLTAYVSQVCGWISHQLAPASVALDTSRGFELPWHKVFMRVTVLVCDLLIYFPPVWLLAAVLARESRLSASAVAVLALCQPALILIDHGHFQYNSVSLGFSLLAFYFFSLIKRPGVQLSDLMGAVCFSLALNFKQMSLYHAPAVFFFLLGRCSAGGSLMAFLCDVIKLGVVVILVFGMLWWPFCAYATPEVGCAGGLLQVLTRLFPFNRGVFEDKVANLWFVLSVKPLSLRSRVPDAALPKLAVLATALLFAVPCWCLFRVGSWAHRMPDRGLKALLWGTTGCALAFFLASFQVHEKSLLLALAPLSLLHTDAYGFVSWQLLAGSWTMYPLLLRDGQVLPYLLIMTAYGVLVPYLGAAAQGSSTRLLPLQSLFIVGSLLLAASLHVLSAVITPPPSKPDLWPTLWAVGGCAIVSCGYFGSVYRLVALCAKPHVKES